MEKPFLHSVILVNGKIIDFNYNMVIDKDLYFKLVKFESLAELDAQKARDTFDFIIWRRDMLNKSKVQTLTMNFAFDNVLDYLQNEERQIEKPDIGIE